MSKKSWNIFPTFYLKCFNELQSFRFQSCMVWEIQKREVVWDGNKRASTNLDAHVNSLDMGVQWVGAQKVPWAWTFWAGAHCTPTIWAVYMCIKIRTTLFFLWNNFYFLYLSAHKIFEFKTLQFTRTFDIEGGKNNLGFFWD